MQEYRVYLESTMIAEIDFRNNAFREDPHGVLTALRQEGALAKVKGLDSYLVTRHAECEALLKDPRVQLAEIKADGFDMNHPMQGYLAMRRGLMLFANPPLHQELRAPATDSMAASTVKLYGAVIEELATEAVSEMRRLLASRRRVDFIQEISIPFVSRVICKIVGMPDQDHAKLAGMTQRVADGLDPLGPRHSLEDAGQAYTEFQSYMEHELAKGRWQGQAEEFSNTFLGSISQCPHMLGGFKNTADLISTSVMLLSAGHLTTNHSLSLSLYSLLDDPKLRPILTVGDEPITALMIEEIFRYHCPAQITRRSVTEEIEVAGKVLHPGQALWLALVSANRDERVFVDGQHLDLARRPNPHLAFGGGTHFCLGAHLARLQLRIFLQAIAGEFPTLHIPPGGVVHDPNIVFRGLKSLTLSI